MSPKDTQGPPPDQIEFGRALRALRRRAGITQRELGARAGTDATAISHMETGRRGVHWITLIRLLRALDADLHQLADTVAEAKKQSDL
jgi:transcriptional regulator with XRE-family HTH domain